MKMHWCTARVNLSGQNCHTVSFSPEDAISWPEVQVLIALHGEENVFDVKPVSVADVNSRMEKDRLWSKYGQVVERVFPGRAFQMEMLKPGEPVDQQTSDSVGQVEKKNGNGDHPDDEDEGDDEAHAAPPTGAVFKPGKHPRPAPGV